MKIKEKSIFTRKTPEGEDGPFAEQRGSEIRQLDQLNPRKGRNSYWRQPKKFKGTTNFIPELKGMSVAKSHAQKERNLLFPSVTLNN